MKHKPAEVWICLAPGETLSRTMATKGLRSVLRAKVHIGPRQPLQAARTCLRLTLSHSSTGLVRQTVRWLLQVAPEAMPP